MAQNDRARQSRSLHGLGALAGIGALGLLYGHIETYLFTVRRVEVPVLAPGEAPIRVLHISDLHLLPTQTRKIYWLRSLAQLQPDLVIDTGDNWAAFNTLPALQYALEGLLEFPGVFVLASNDYWAPTPLNPASYLLHDSRHNRKSKIELPWDSLVEMFVAAGWQDANGRRGEVKLPDGRVIAFIGTHDAHMDEDEVPARLAAAAVPGAGDPGSEPVGTTRLRPVENPSGNPPVLRIGITHAPYRHVLDELSDAGAEVIFAGHTHGGQVCLPGFGAIVTNCDLDRGRAAGLTGWPAARPDAPGGENSVWLHVSAGAGTSPMAPYRLACRPEATLLTLTAKRD